MSTGWSGGRDYVDARIARAAERMAETRQRLTARHTRGPIIGRATGARGAITVTAAPGGTLVDVRIEQSALSLHPDELAAELVRLAGVATRNANARLRRTAEPVVDAGVLDSMTKLGIEQAPDDDGEQRSVLRRR